MATMSSDYTIEFDICPYCKRNTSNPRYGLCNKCRRKDKKLQTRYSITIDDYHDMLEEQDGRCRICNKASKLHVDHDHKTHEVRGLLCNSCNVGLGHFKDNISLIQKAATYLI
jgi:hypothetical protein